MRRLKVLLITLLCCSSAAMGCVSAPPNVGRVKVDRIVVLKSKHLLILMANEKPLASYRVALGGTSGPKERQGDNKTPEGQYVIDQKNAKSRFHLALHISYPNAADRDRARKLGVSPGGDVEIHGLDSKYAWVGSLQHQVDWTDGCIALTNTEIDEIWPLVQVGTPVDIRP